MKIVIEIPDDAVATEPDVRLLLRDALIEALDTAPIVRVDETLEQFRVRYSAWYREARNSALKLAKGET